MLFLGIDCGTQSLKVLAWSPEEGSVASAARSYDLIEGLPPGHKEQHPQVWVGALEECMQQLGSELDLTEVRAIGVSGQQHGLVVLDQEDQVIRPAKLWNDTSTQEQCETLVRHCGGPEAYRREIGNSLPPGFTASKILWLQEKEPENYDRISTILLPHDYLNFYLTAEKTAEPGDASGTGYFKVRERVWSATVLQALDSERDLSRCLPRLIDSDVPAGSLRSSLSDRWGLAPGVTVSSGGGDNMMGAIGSGNVKPGVVTLSLGTSGTIFSCSPSPVIDPRGEIAAFCDSTGRWLPLGCTMNVTVATEMVRKNFLDVDHAGFESEIEKVPPGCEGLILIPYLEGERMPSVPSGTGVFLGVRPQTARPGYLARAAMEGVTLGLRYGLERLQEIGVTAEEVRLIGGGAKSRVWRQIVADIFALPVACPEIEEGPALGSALHAFWIHSGQDIEQLGDTYIRLNPDSRHEPQKDLATLHRDLYRLYAETSRTLRESGTFKIHAGLLQA